MAERPKRLGIFVTYDAEGIVDDYIPYLLDDMCKNLDHLIIVCNGYVNEEGLSKLRRFTSDVFVRENVGYDAGAIKDVLYNLYGWENILIFEELVLFNDSFFGPLYSLSEVFRIMDSKAIDFWGLINQNEFTFDSFRRLSSHINTYFIVIREHMLKSTDFVEFWDTMPQGNTFFDAVYNYEIRLNMFFSERGYSSDAFVSLDKHLVNASLSTNEPLYVYELPYETVVINRCPIIKRKAFVSDIHSILKSTNAEGHAKLLDYIDKETDYDVNLIWEHILRIYDIHDLRQTMHFDCVIPSRSFALEHGAHIDSIVIIVNASNPFIKDEINKCMKKNNFITYVCLYSNEVDASTINIQNYEYICYIGDLNYENNTSFPIIRSAINTTLENTIKYSNFVKNIINKFAQNPRLGLLTPPSPLHGQFFSSYGGGWGDDFEEAQEIAQSIGVRNGLSMLKQPFMSESAFWCRTDALSHATGYDLLKGLTSAQMKVLPYAVQKAGYYSAVVMSDDYAALNNTNSEYIIRKMKNLFYNGSDKMSFHNFVSSQIYSQMLDFAGRFTTVYIYGAGDFAGRCADNLISHNVGFAGFVVTDSRRKQDMLLNHPICFLSEIEPPSDSIGIILGMDKGNTSQVYTLLMDKGYNNLYVMS